MITEIVEARTSISYHSTFRTPKFGQKSEKFKVFAQKRPPIPLQTDSECCFTLDQNLARLCTY